MKLRENNILFLDNKSGMNDIDVSNTKDLILFKVNVRDIKVKQRIHFYVITPLQGIKLCYRDESKLSVFPYVTRVHDRRNQIVSM